MSEARDLTRKRSQTVPIDHRCLGIVRDKGSHYAKVVFADYLVYRKPVLRRFPRKQIIDKTASEHDPVVQAGLIESDLYKLCQIAENF